MRHLATVTSYLVVCALVGAPASASDWLILKGGKKIETEGAWVLQGDLLTVHETSGRITTVSTAIVDSTASLQKNPRNLRIVTLPIPMKVGTTPVAGSQIWPRPTPNPGVPRSVPLPAGTALPEAPLSTPSATAAAATPSAPAGGTVAGSSATAASTPSAASPSPAATSAGADAALKARKQAAQDEMRREIEYRKIVSGCARMFLLDPPSYQRCVQVQSQTAAASPASLK